MYKNSVICQTCLSTERRLYPLKDLQCVLREIKFRELKDPDGGICWECRSHVVRFFKFQHQAEQAQHILIYAGLMKQNNIQCLSSLSCRTIDKYDQQYYHINLDVNENSDTFSIQDVKEEIITEENNDVDSVGISEDSIHPQHYEVYLSDAVECRQEKEIAPATDDLLQPIATEDFNIECDVNPADALYNLNLKDEPVDIPNDYMDCESNYHLQLEENLENSSHIVQSDNEAFNAVYIEELDNGQVENSLTEVNSNLDLLQKVFSVMEDDETSKTAKNDPLICAFGNTLLTKHVDMNRDCLNYKISHDMRQIAEIFMKMSVKKKKLLTFIDALRTKFYFDIVEAVVVVSNRTLAEALSLSVMVIKCTEIANSKFEYFSANYKKAKKVKNDIEELFHKLNTNLQNDVTSKIESTNLKEHGVEQVINEPEKLNNSEPILKQNRWWTTKQRSMLYINFSSNLENKIEPKKTEIQQFMKKYKKLYQDKTWRQLYQFVMSRINGDNEDNEECNNVLGILNFENVLLAFDTEERTDENRKPENCYNKFGLVEDESEKFISFSKTQLVKINEVFTDHFQNKKLPKKSEIETFLLNHTDLFYNNIWLEIYLYIRDQLKNHLKEDIHDSVDGDFLHTSFLMVDENDLDLNAKTVFSLAVPDNYASYMKDEVETQAEERCIECPRNEVPDIKICKNKSKTSRTKHSRDSTINSIKKKHSTFKCKFIARKGHVKPNGKNRGAPLSSKEKDIIINYFNRHIEMKKCPNKVEVVKFIGTYPDLYRNRRAQTVMLFLSNIIRFNLQNSKYSPEETKKTREKTNNVKSLDNNNTWSRKQISVVCDYFRENIKNNIKPLKKQIKEFISRHNSLYKNKKILDVFKLVLSRINFSNCKKMKQKRNRMSRDEKTKVLEYFDEYIKSKKIPPKVEIEKFRQKNPQLSVRKNAQMILSFLSSEFRNKRVSCTNRTSAKDIWSEEQMSNIHNYFDTYIKARQKPSKLIIEKFINEYRELYSSKKWQEIQLLVLKLFSSSVSPKELLKTRDLQHNTSNNSANRNKNIKDNYKNETKYTNQITNFNMEVSVDDKTDLSHTSIPNSMYEHQIVKSHADGNNSFISPKTSCKVHKLENRESINGIFTEEEMSNISEYFKAYIKTCQKPSKLIIDEFVNKHREFSHKKWQDIQSFVMKSYKSKQFSETLTKVHDLENQNSNSSETIDKMTKLNFNAEPGNRSEIMTNISKTSQNIEISFDSETDIPHNLIPNSTINDLQIIKSIADENHSLLISPEMVTEVHKSENRVFNDKDVELDCNKEAKNNCEVEGSISETSQNYEHPIESTKDVPYNGIPNDVENVSEKVIRRFSNTIIEIDVVRESYSSDPHFSSERVIDTEDRCTTTKLTIHENQTLASSSVNDSTSDTNYTVNEDVNLNEKDHSFESVRRKKCNIENDSDGSEQIYISREIEKINNSPRSVDSMDVKKQHLNDNIKNKNIDVQLLNISDYENLENGKDIDINICNLKRKTSVTVDNNFYDILRPSLDCQNIINEFDGDVAMEITVKTDDESDEQRQNTCIKHNLIEISDEFIQDVCKDRANVDYISFDNFKLKLTIVIFFKDFIMRRQFPSWNIIKEFVQNYKNVCGKIGPSCINIWLMKVFNKLQGKLADEFINSITQKTFDFINSINFDDNLPQCKRKYVKRNISVESILRSHFKNFIEQNLVPSREECVEFKKKYPTLFSDQDSSQINKWFEQLFNVKNDIDPNRIIKKVVISPMKFQSENKKGQSFKSDVCYPEHLKRNLVTNVLVPTEMKCLERTTSDDNVKRLKFGSDIMCNEITSEAERLAAKQTCLTDTFHTYAISSTSIEGAEVVSNNETIEDDSITD